MLQRTHAECVYITYLPSNADHETADPLMKFYDDKGVLRHFEVKKGLDDLPQVMEMLGTELGVDL